MTTAEELAKIDAALEKLYDSNVEEWSEASERVRRIRYEALTARKDVLTARLAGEGAGGAMIRPIQPVDD